MVAYRLVKIPWWFATSAAARDDSIDKYLRGEMNQLVRRGTMGVCSFINVESPSSDGEWLAGVW